MRSFPSISADLAPTVPLGLLLLTFCSFLVLHQRSVIAAATNPRIVSNFDDLAARFESLPLPELSLVSSVTFSSAR